MSRPTVVFITPTLPYPLTDGLSIRQFHLLRAYARVAPVKLVFFHDDPASLTATATLEPYCASFHPVPAETTFRHRLTGLPLWRRRLEQTGTLTPDLPRQFTSPQMQSLVTALAESADLVHVSRLFMVPNVEPALHRRSATTRFILDLDDVETVVAERARRLAPSPSWQRRLFESFDALRLARYQARAVDSFDRIFVCSAHDRRRLDHGDPIVVPNGTTIPAELLPDESDGRTLLYLGLLSYEPNIDGLLFFVREIFPLVRKAVPEARLLVVGRAPAREVLALHDGKTICIEGEVPAVEPYYRQSTLSIVTLRMGGGTRLRILEAFALGRPVVSTSIGCEGLDVVDGEHLFVSDDPREFAQRCIQLLAAPELRTQLVTNSRKLVETTYDWHFIERHVEQVAGELLVGPARPPAQRAHQAVQRDAFGELVDQGVYSLDFDHSTEARTFLSECILTALASIDQRRPLSVLECGCGTGAWLNFLAETLQAGGYPGGQYYGFDLTPGMVELAQKKLGSRVPSHHLRVGDVLDNDSYVYEGGNGHFDLIYAYDLIQQLPRSQQLRGCEAMASRLAPGGVLILFDHERRSMYGLKMGAKKFLTHRFGLNLVPRFYCNARYPALRRLSRRLRQQGFLTQIREASSSPKRALIVRSSAAPSR